MTAERFAGVRARLVTGVVTFDRSHGLNYTRPRIGFGRGVLYNSSQKIRRDLLSRRVKIEMRQMVRLRQKRRQKVCLSHCFFLLKCVSEVEYAVPSPRYG